MVCHNTEGSVFGISKKHDLSETGPIPIFRESMKRCPNVTTLIPWTSA
jgi:hypothetical protein